MVRNDLFRKQVLEAKRATSALYGRPSATVPPAWSWYIGGLALFFAGLLCFITLVDIARKETVRGRLKYTSAEARISANRAGIIQKLYVSDGDMVRIGDPLVEVTSEQYLQDGATLSALSGEQLNRELDLLEDRRITVHRTAEITSEGLQQRQASLRSAISRNDARQNTLSERLIEAQARFDETQGFFEEGLITKAQVDERQTAYDLIETELLAVQRRLDDDQAELESIAYELQQVLTDRDQQIASINQETARIEGRRGDLFSNSGYRLVASTEGTVTALQVRSGEPVETGQLTMAIVPNDSELYAELYLPSRAIAFIQPGQTVRLQYDALPYQKFGVALGKVKSVADTALLSTDLRLPAASEELLYRIEVELNDQSVQAYGKPVPLQSGMELSADIVLEDRRVMEWLFSGLRRP